MRTPPRRQTIELEGEGATRAWAADLAAQLGPGDVLLLDGPVGAGKTTLVRALVAAWGGDPAAVSSPTFTLLHRYSGRVPVVHVDAYRLGSADELAAIGFHEQAADAVACIEWASRVPGLLDPAACWQVSLEHLDPDRRLATLTVPQRPTPMPSKPSLPELPPA